MLNAFSKIRQQGFSLIEVMVAVAILAILASFAVPSFQIMLQNSQIRNASESILNGLQRARAEAVQQNRNIEFVLSGTDANCWNAGNGISETCTSWQVQWVTGGGGASQVAGLVADPIVSSITNEGSQNVKRATLPAGTNTVTFDSTGRKVGNNDGSVPIDQITFTSTVLPPAKSHDLRIVIGTPSAGGGNVGGTARMCDPSLPNGTPRGCI
jgi:type IV fimbrial biogenesis protein FimT